MANKQDSNLTGLYIAEESSLGVLPGSPYWYQMDPNSYPEFGGELTKVARTVISPTRKMLKGGVTDLDASAGFEHDFVPEGILKFMRGFFFTDGDEHGDTISSLDETGWNACTDVDGTTNERFTFTTSMAAFFPGSLVYHSGFSNAENNGLFTVAVQASSTYDVDESTPVDEASPPATARSRVVGYQFGTGELAATTSGSTLYLTRSGSSATWTTLNVKVGDTIFLGGDTSGAAGDQFTTLGTGYCVISAISTDVLTCVDFIGTLADDAAGTEAIKVFFGCQRFRDEPLYTDINRHSYTIERTLGDDAGNTQSEYVNGAVPNEVQISFPQADKISCTMSYVALNRLLRTGVQGPLNEAGGTVVSLPSESFLNTSTDMHTARLRSGGSSLVGYLESANITINNGVSPNKAIGVLGAFDMSTGDFEVTGSVNAYFDTVAVLQALQDNDDVSFQIVAARSNEGLAMHLPLVTLSGGQPEVASDEPIMLPLDLTAAASDGNVTLSFTFFPYLPDAAMPA